MNIYFNIENMLQISKLTKGITMDKCEITLIV